MATREALQMREERAVKRLTEAATKIATEAGIEPPQISMTDVRRPGQEAELARLEAVADFLESIMVTGNAEDDPDLVDPLAQQQAQIEAEKAKSTRSKSTRGKR